LQPVPVSDAPNKKVTGRPLTPSGIVVHHTASSAKASDSAIIQMCINGVNKVPGPLYNFLISRDGTIWALTAENIKANHAGRGNRSVLDRIMSGKPVEGRATKPGKITANGRLFGVSIINDGLGQDIPPEQYEACVDVCARLCDKYQLNPLAAVCGHLEWTSRKVDPTFDMGDFRAAVASQTEEIPALKNLKVEKILPPEPPRGRYIDFPGTLRRGSKSEAVKLVQRRVGAGADGSYGRQTESKVKEWQRRWNHHGSPTANPLSVDGVVGPLTWECMALRRMNQEDFFT